MKRILLAIFLAMAGLPQSAEAAIGCTLSNPAEDLKFLYPEMTTYKESLIEFPRLKNGAELFKGLKQRLGSDMDPIYEAYETPFTVYSVFAGQKKIGVVHGVNVPGKGGVIQVFLATDPQNGVITNFFFQRLESPAARLLRAKDFRTQFNGLSLADFYKHDYFAAAQPAARTDKVGAIKPPANDATTQTEFQTTLRGMRKNLILLDYFVYDRRSEPFYERAQQAIANQKKGGN